MRSIVQTAKLTIPLAAGETMAALSWPEAQVADLSRRTQYEKAVRERIDVYDDNMGQRDRDYAQMHVLYKDRDGQRAAAFLNALVTTWIDKRLRELREPAEAARREANDKVKVQRDLYEHYAEETRQLSQTYEIDPTLSSDLLKFNLQQEQQRLQTELRKGLQEAERALETGKRLQQADRDLLARTEPRVTPDAAQLVEKAKQSPEGRLIALALEGYQAMKANFQPGTDPYRRAEMGIAEQEQKLRDLVGSSEVDADGMVPNPIFAALQARIDQRDTELAVLETEFQTRKAQFDTESERVARRAQGFFEYDKVRQQLELAKKDLEVANDDLRAAITVLAGLSRQQTVTQFGTAQPPPRPTEPNILVVAMIGCVLGLGVAIGLILLLDFVQGTFKTVDDVERALPVPVLGGMSHLETEAERIDNVRRRRRVSLVASAFVALVVIVVTIFYVDPTRLPPVVRDLLAMLLG